jgi:hypothetical protein
MPAAQLRTIRLLASPRTAALSFSSRRRLASAAPSPSAADHNIQDLEQVHDNVSHDVLFSQLWFRHWLACLTRTDTAFLGSRHTYIAMLPHYLSENSTLYGMCWMYRDVKRGTGRHA